MICIFNQFITITGDYMKYLTAVSLVALLASASANAQMENPLYMSISGDLTWINDTSVKSGAGGSVNYDMGGGGMVAIGLDNLNRYSPFSGLRGEIEAGYHSADVEDVNGSLRIGTLMANVYYDMRNYSQFTPYVGLGLGDAEIYLSRSAGFGNSDNKDNEFAYQAMVGISYIPKAMPMTDWSVGYHYLGIYKPEFGDLELESLNTHSLELGMRYHF
jgi:opacity protein-like surface antigen